MCKSICPCLVRLHPETCNLLLDTWAPHVAAAHVAEEGAVGGDGGGHGTVSPGVAGVHVVHHVVTWRPRHPRLVQTLENGIRNRYWGLDTGLSSFELYGTDLRRGPWLGGGTLDGGGTSGPWCRLGGDGRMGGVAARDRLSWPGAGQGNDH